LREFVRIWEDFESLNLIVSGEPFDFGPLCETGCRAYRLFTGTGFFSNADEQNQYLQRYLPPELIQSENGHKLISRIWLWFRGRRYRLTASLLSCLLQTRFQSPHTLLTAYVAASARVEPPDSPLHMDRRIRDAHCWVISRIGSYKGTSVSNDVLAWFAAHMAMHRMIVFGEDGVVLTKECQRIVSQSFAIFSDTDGSSVVINEPMYVFPIAHFLFKQEGGPAYGFLGTRAALALEAPPLYESLHLAAVTLLLLALRGRLRLCDLFELRTPCPSWAQQPCKLVRMMRDDEDGRLRASPFSTAFPDGYSDERWATESADWTHQPAPEPFCVAAQFSHADLLFVVQLEDGHLLPIALKVMVK
ncbi:hypothetical protein HDZ31DRAFT_13637, partial [Schizophyllum fasciatum]